MKFTCSVDIDLPRQRVVELLDNPENMKHWQDGLISYEFIEGEPGKVGSKMKMRYSNGKREFDLIETITISDFPREFAGTYEATMMKNTMSNLFFERGENRTTWEAHIHYTWFKGFMIKLFVWLSPGTFKKQTQKWLDQFKAFAEAQGPAPDNNDA